MKGKVFERSAKSPLEYSIAMQEHLEILEALKEHELDGGELSEMWVFEHEDGRVARLPEPKVIVELRKREEIRSQLWMRIYKRKAERYD